MRIGGAGKTQKKATACWPFSVATKIFSVAIELLVLCYDVVLCVATWFSSYSGLLGHDRGFPGHYRVVFFLFFYCDRGPHGVAAMFLFSVVTMSRQRFPCRDGDDHNKRAGLRRSLVKAKRFPVATEIYSVVIEFHGVVSQQGIPCRDRDLAKTKGFLSRQNIFMSR